MKTFAIFTFRLSSKTIWYKELYWNVCELWIFKLQGAMLEGIVAGHFDTTYNESVVMLEDLIFERRDKICLPATKLSSKLNVTRIQSIFVGGTFELVENSIGTLWEVQAEGRILLLEDIGYNATYAEKQLDRMKYSRVFNGIKAVIFGDFVEPDDDDLIDLVLDRFAQSVSFPVFRITGTAHGEVNYPLPLLTSSVINSIDGVIYEFCVDNIQNSASSNSVYQTCNFILLAVILIHASIY